MRPLPPRRLGLLLLALLGLSIFHASRVPEASAPGVRPAPSHAAALPAAAPPPATPDFVTADLAAWQHDSASARPDLAALPAWAGRWFAAPPDARDAGLLDEGVALALQRRDFLRTLIPVDPRAALAAATPYSVRAALPEEMRALLEEPLSGAHAYDVIIACGGDHDAPGHVHSVERRLTVGDRAFHAFTYGERLATTTKHSLPVHGIAVDELAALHADPVRRLSPAEAAARGLASARVPSEIAGRLHALPDDAALAAWSAALLADERRLGPFPGPAHRAALAGQPSPPPPSAAPSPAAATPGADTPAASADSPPAAESAWTEGAKTMLYIRARFADEAADFTPLALSTAQSRQNTVDQHLQNASYGKTSLTTTYTDVIALPQNASFYTNAFSSLLGDAVAAAKAANPAWDSAAFNLYAVVTSNKAGFAYAGKAWVGSAGAHLRADYTSLRTAGHEYGHNFGLWHANYWRTDSTFPVGRDSVPGGYVGDGSGDEWLEYGHRFSLMSAQFTSEFDNAAIPHFSVVEKFRLDWLTASSGLATLASTPSTGTTVRLYRQDHPSAVNTRGLRIDLPASDYTSQFDTSKRRYWLSYRRAFTSGTAGAYSPHGIEVEWARNSYGSDGAIQLDLTPFTRNATDFYNKANPPSNYWTIDNTDKEDAQLPLGLTYSDPAAGIHFTPVATGDDDGVANNGNEWIEVDVRLGAFPGNRPPSVTLSASTTTPAVNGSVTFTAHATDPDGDALSYWWDFGDNTVHVPALDNPSPSKSWSAAAVRVVRVVVSDRKGGQTVAQLPVTIGAPANTAQILGRVLHGGQPVVGARVHVGSTYQTWTDSEGRYLLVGLPSGNHTVSCRKDGLTFTARFTNPVSTASGSQYGRDFYANEPLTSGGGATYSVSGGVGNFSAPLAGVVIEAGGLRTTTDANGAYTLSGLAAGTYTLTARLAPYVFTPASTGITITNTNLIDRHFSVQRHTVSGSISGVGNNPNPAPTIFLLDGTGVSTNRQGNNLNYSLSVPAGSWSVFASLPGFVLTPSFTNPLAVTGNTHNRNFTGAAGADTHAIVGSVTFQGRPLAGVTVSLTGAATAGVTTDAFGRYRFHNLPATASAVTASRAGYSFSPASVSLTPSSSPAAAADFTAASTSASTAAPAVASVSASPSSAPVGGTVTLSASATGPGPLSYRWAATSAPGPVGFSVNDSASAATTVATLSNPGSYTFAVIVTDANGFTASGTVTATASNGPATLVLSPYEVVVNAGASLTFRADAFDASGALVAVSPAFSTSGGGAIDPSSGLFHATTGGTHTITATAAGLTAHATLTVVGNVANTAPNIGAIPPQTIPANGTTGALPFTIGDAETPPASLTLARASSHPALIPPEGIVLGGAGADRTVTITPATNQSGVATITLTVSDGALATQTDFTVTVTETLTSWINTQPGVGSLTAPGDDPDGDGLPNLLEYALGTAPGSADSTSALALQLASPEPEQAPRLALTFTPARIAGLSFAVESSSDLATWSSTPLTDLQAGQPHTHTDSVPLAGSTRRFLRLRVTQD
jgi:hypothetical protein